MHTLRRSTGILVVCLLVLLVPIPAYSQSGTQVVRNELELYFPYSITFHLSLESSRQITQVTLIYGTNGKTCQSGSVRQSIDIEPRKTVAAEWEWNFKRSGVLPPGSEVWWQWEIIDITGMEILTEKITATIQDQRQDWQTVSGGGITVLWYEGSRSYGQSILNSAKTSLERLKETAGMEPSGEVTISIYPDYEELRSALLYSNVWTGGVAHPEYNAMVIGIPEQNISLAKDVISHELAHLVVNSTIFNCKGNDFPVWLNEGFAVFMEGPIGEEERQDVISALEQGNLPTLLSLEDGFSSQPSQAVRSYAQSALVVEYLIEEYGIEKVNQLLASFQSGNEIETALVEVYGFDTASLDDSWRSSLGFETSGGASPTDQPEVAKATATQIPTLALWNPIAQPTATVSPTPAPTDTELAPSPAPTATNIPPTAAAEGATQPTKSGVLPVAISGAGVLLLLAVGVLIVSRRRKSE